MTDFRSSSSAAFDGLEEAVQRARRPCLYTPLQQFFRCLYRLGRVIFCGQTVPRRSILIDLYYETDQETT